jgi:LPS sulfotransferase NodH
MHTLVHIPTGLATPELEIMLATAQDAIDKGQETTIVTCSGGKGYGCSLNPHGVALTCHVCKAVRAQGIATLRGNYSLVETPASLPTPPLNLTRKQALQDRWTIKEHRTEGVDVGQAAYSSYIGLSRDQDLEGRLARRTLNRLLATSEQLVPWFRALIHSRKITKVILYNGRQNQYRPLLRVSQQENVAIDTMEFCGQEARCVYIFRNQLPQDISVLEEMIEECWKNFTGNVAEVAQYFYSFKRAGGIVNDLRAYVAGQTRGLLPEGWDPIRHNIAIFNSSEDEYAAVGGEYDKTLYINQTDAMQRLCVSLADDPDVVLWLRIHPNLSGVHWSFAEKLLLLEERFSNVRIIRGDSKVSTYDLLDACNTAVSFGSTMGIEAVYWGKPSILLGRCVYEKIGSVYTPRTHEEAVGLIRTRNLAQLPTEGALKVALFWSRGGQSIPHFTGSRTTGFFFNNQQFKKTKLQEWLYTIAKFYEKIILERWRNYQFGTSRRRIREYRSHA